MSFSPKTSASLKLLGDTVSSSVMSRAVAEFAREDTGGTKVEMDDGRVVAVCREDVSLPRVG